MVDVIVLAMALSMDAFAVSIGLGAKHMDKTKFLTILAAIYFGVFQGIMPLIGYFCSKSILPWIDTYASIFAFILLISIGGKMFYEAFASKSNNEIPKVSHKVMLTLAIATSIDAMAAGFSLLLLDVNEYLACAIIGLTTAIFSSFGVLIGVKGGVWLENKAEIFGGSILILIGFKLLIM